MRSEFDPTSAADRPAGSRSLSASLAEVRPRVRVKARMGPATAGPQRAGTAGAGIEAPPGRHETPPLVLPRCLTEAPCEPARRGPDLYPRQDRLVASDDPGEPPMRLPASWLAASPPTKPAMPLRFVATRHMGMAVAVGLAAISALSSNLAWWWQPRPIDAGAGDVVLERGAEPAAPRHEVASLGDTARPSRFDFAPLLQGGTHHRPMIAPPHSDRAVTSARRAIARGDIVGARALLAEAAAVEDAGALLLLAETYDPRMLAAWGTRGVAADSIAAITYYARARAAGHPVAAERLQALE
jgi:hypothetical protein